jgi:RNA recognition motif-containing protein
MSELDLRNHFSQFGDVEHVTLVKDKMTKESKGFGYVKYHKYVVCERRF